MHKGERRFISKEHLASPHISFIQNSANALIMDVERLGKSSYPFELTPKESAFSRDLSDALYTGKLTSAREARSMLGRLNEGDLQNEAFLRFAKDLDYLSIYEAKGIGGLNQRLLYLMAELKKRPDKDLFIDLANEFNDLLYRAIYLFPHEIRSVEVVVKPGYQERNPDYKYLEGRDMYTYLQKIYQELNRVPLPQELVLPLPYYYGTGTHGSDERSAQSKSYESVGLEYAFIHNKDTVVVNVNLEESIFSIRKTGFTLDEIESVRFSTNTNFTQLVSSRQQLSLVERNEYFSHYLRFREFYRLRINQAKANEQEFEALKRILGVSYGSSLWNIYYGIFGRELLEQGFFIEQDEQNEKSVLFEVNNVGIKEIDPLVETANMFLRFIRQRRKVPKNMRIFQGANIINRLVAVPPKGKFDVTTPFIGSGKPLAKLVNNTNQFDSPSHSHIKLTNEKRRLEPVFS